jgi:hypothetical protein
MALEAESRIDLNIYFTQLFYIGPDSPHVDKKVCKKLNMVLNPQYAKAN